MWIGHKEASSSGKPKMNVSASHLHPWLPFPFPGSWLALAPTRFLFVTLTQVSVRKTATWGVAETYLA